MKDYFSILGVVALALGSVGAGRRSGHEESDWAKGLLAMEAWRWFWWIAAGWGVISYVAWVVGSYGSKTPRAW